MITTPIREPWDRQPNEPEAAFQRFDLYFRPQAADGPYGRNVSEAYRRYQDQLGKDGRRKRVPPGRFQAEARAWSWRERATAWDDHLRSQRMVDERRAIAAMHREHAEQAVELRSVAMNQLQRFMDRQVPHPDDPTRTITVPAEPMRGHEVIRFFAETVRAEREARGVSPEVLELVIKLSAMSDEELQAHYLGLLGRAGAEECDH